MIMVLQEGLTRVITRQDQASTVLIQLDRKQSGDLLIPTGIADIQDNLPIPEIQVQYEVPTPVQEVPEP